MESPQSKPIAILGAGSWGTALALHLARCGQTVRIFSIETAEITAMLADKANNRYLPGIPLPDKIQPKIQLEEAVAGVNDILMVVPSVGFRKTLIHLKPLINANVRLICATKGLDTETGQLMSEVTEDVLGKEQPFAALSGPSFAREVAIGMPTAVMIASKHKALITDLMHRFNSANFRTYPSDDVIGVEIGGVVKNVIAIATGISDGMNFGTNARSALITHGLAEITRLGVALGARAETFIGLSGMGDLILTSTDDQSRNRRLGLAIGKGKNITEAEREIGQVVEGKRNAELVSMIALKHRVAMPICETVWQILQGKLQAKEAVEQLLFHPVESINA